MPTSACWTPGLRCGPFPLYSSSCKLCPRMHNLIESPHKSFVVWCQSEEATYIMYILRFRPLNDSPNLVRRGPNSPRADFKTQVIYLGPSKLHICEVAHTTWPLWAVPMRTEGVANAHLYSDWKLGCRPGILQWTFQCCPWRPYSSAVESWQVHCTTRMAWQGTQNGLG